MKCFIPAGLIVTTLFLGCSDDREPAPEAGVDAGVNDSGANADVVQDVSAPDGPAPDRYIDLFDVFPLPDGGCTGCIKDRCGAQINACFNNPACTAGLFCTLQMCAGGLLGDSGFTPANIACVLGCFNGDQNLAFMALGSFTCLTMTCASACTFFDAGFDARPPSPDVQMPPDASVDAPEDTGNDSTAPDGDPGTDTGSDDAVDGAGPGPDAADDAVDNDVTADVGDEPDTALPPDAPPSEEGGAD